MDAQIIQQRIGAAIPDAAIHPVDLTGGGDHWFCAVVSQSFAGERPLARQRRVFAAVADDMASGAIHALDLKCLTPDELEARHGGVVPAPFVPHDEGMPGMHKRP